MVYKSSSIAGGSGGGGSGTITSITSTGSTITVTNGGGPTTNVDINLSNANTWTGQQTFNTSAAIFGVGAITPKIYPASDSTTAIQILKADGTTNVVNIDTTNSAMGVGTTSPSIGEFGSTFTAKGGTGLGIITAQRNDNVATHGTGFQCVLNDASSNPITYSYFNGLIVSNTAGAASGALAFFTRNAGTLAEKMRLDNTGALGVGTTSFGTLNKLTVNPNTSTDNSAVAQINTINTTDNGLTLNMVASPSGKALRVTNNSGTDVAMLMGTGKLSLGGNVVPSAQMYLNATGSAQGFIVGNVDSLGQQTHFAICTGATGSVAGEYWNSYKDANGWIINTAHTSGSTRRFRFRVDDTGQAFVINTDNRIGNVLSPAAQFEMDALINTNVVAILQGAASQSGDILQLRNSTPSVLTSFSSAGLVNNYNLVATAGLGVPAIYGSGRSTAQTAAVASVAAYTVGASDGSFIVSANVNVTTSTTHSFSVQVTYTDEGNTARTVTFNVQQLGGTLVTSITNVTGAGPYEGVPLHIRAKASTAITILTSGTFTSVTYNVEGLISQMA